MKKRRGLLCILFLLSLQAAWAEQIPLTLIHINDIHGHILPDRRTGDRGMAILAGFLEQQRRLEPDLIFLDAGDLETGSAIDNLTRGEATYELYGALSPDVHVLGNHAFDYGLDLLFRNLSKARFPVVCANYPFSLRQRERIAPYVILVRQGLRIAVLGLTIPKAVKGLGAAEDPLKTADHYLEKLKKEADLVIALTHLGVDRDEELAKHAPALDIIVGGHSHAALEKPLIVGNTYILQAGAYGAYAGKVHITFDTDRKRITALEGSLVPLDKTYPPDENIISHVRAFYAASNMNLDEPLVEVDKEYSRIAVADLVAQKLWTRYRPDFSLEHPGGFRVPLVPGTLYRDDLYRVFPFDNVMVKFSIPASDLTEPLFTAQLHMWYNEPLLVSYPSHDNLKKYGNREITIVASNYVARMLEKHLGRSLSPRSLNVGERTIIEQALLDRFPSKMPEARSAFFWERWSLIFAGIEGSSLYWDAR